MHVVHESYPQDIQRQFGLYCGEQIICFWRQSRTPSINSFLWLKKRYDEGNSTAIGLLSVDLCLWGFSYPRVHIV